jgi:hypothetical protein
MKFQTIDTPAAFAKAVAQKTIEVLQLADTSSPGSPGWTTYSPEIDEGPECEIICGGVNEKTPTAAAIWRQGHLLHFGFEEAPNQLNANGRALFLNAIAYIAKFTEDRPIVSPTSVFTGAKSSLMRRKVIERLKSGDDIPIDSMFCEKPTKHFSSISDPNDRSAEFAKSQGLYVPAQGGKLDVDPNLVLIGAASNNTREFFDTAIKKLDDPSDPIKAAARAALERYVGDAAPTPKTSAAWTSWFRDNSDYLFFSDASGYVWLIDPLAKKRGIPSAKLRGPARASTRP